MAEREEELKSVLMKVKEESEKFGLKAQHSENKDDKPRQCIKKQRHYFTDKDLSSQSYGVSSNHVQMWELDDKEGWAQKNWWFWTVVLKTFGLQGDQTSHS